MKTKKQIIRYVPLVIALLFFMNPNISIIDLLPDFIGYLLICFALLKLSDINDSFGEAYKLFKRMIFIDASKWLALLWLLGLADPRERNTAFLLWTFIFCVIELLCLIPAYSKLFDGFANIGYLLPNKSVLVSGRNSRTKIISILFVITKTVFYTLPEFSVLTSTSYNETSFGGVNLYDYIGIMRLLSLLPVFVMGVAWFVFMILYFRAIIRDKVFNEALYEKYQKDILPKRGLFVKRNFRTVTLLCIIALCLTFDFRVDSQNIIPDFLAAAMFCVLFVFVQKYNGVRKSSWVYSVITFSYASVISFACEFYFFSQHYYGDIIRSNAVRSLYAVIIVATILKSLSFIAMVFDLCKALMNTIYSHTGYVVGMERVGESEKRMVTALHNDLKKTLVYAFIFAALYAVSDICYAVFALQVKFMGLINAVFAVACIAFFVKALSAIQHAIDTKYMLE